MAEHSPGADMLVWMADWQLQCCGDIFSRGDSVTWPLVDQDDDRRWLRHVLGDELGNQVTHIEDHHGVEVEDTTTEVSGTVTDIQLVRVAWGGDPGYPVAGSGVREEIETVVKWPDPQEPAPDRDAAMFCGYLVRLHT